MMSKSLVALWRGDMELGRAFWTYAVTVGTLVHLLATLVAFIVLAADGPGWLAVAIFLSPAPYTLLAVVGVWRSAARHKGDARWADAARIGVVIWAVVATVI